MDKEYFVSRLMSISRQNKIDVDAEILERIVGISVFRVVGKGEVFCHIGDKSENAGLVLSGIARCCYVDEDGRNITRGFSVEGTLCMDEGMFGYSEYICEWEAMGDTTLMLFRVEEMKKLIFENEKLKNEYIMLLEKALQYKIYRENGFLVENAAERYIHFRKLFPEICSAVPQQHIATYLGITPESLSRIRKSLKENE